tara:strand:- start:203 stop:418 length:216 start_codon:yes stop_codon:yes gene_type:complete
MTAQPFHSHCEFKIILVVPVARLVVLVQSQPAPSQRSLRRNQRAGRSVVCTVTQSGAGLWLFDFPETNLGW